MTITPRVGAVALLSAAAVYAVAAVATGRSARSEIPPEVSPRAADAAVDVWRAAAGLIEAEGRAAVLDVRPGEAFARYHLPGAESLPGASGEDVAARAQGRAFVLVYAAKDEVAQRLVAEARRLVPGARVHYLADGARAWYLSLALPVPLFSEAPPPDGYGDALTTLDGYLTRPVPGAKAAALEAVRTLARLGYGPSLLKAGPRPAAAGGKKKLSGGCG